MTAEHSRLDDLLPLYPSLYQINTRVWLTELSQALGRPATLDDIPDAELDRLAEMGFDWIWFLSVWQTGPAGQRISRSNPEWRREFQETLPDLREEDIPGSGFAITGYTVHEQLGGDAALARLRERLRKRGLRLLLDFVPNHTGLDHPWVESHPEYYIPGTELDLARAPQNYTWVKRKQGDLLLAHGRDPYFPGWPDTLQLNYGNPATQEAMIGELREDRRAVRRRALRHGHAGAAGRLRADLGHPGAALLADRRPSACGSRSPDFCFMAEVYWDLEWTLQQQGFDYTYDKRLYDRLRDGHARPVREHFHAGLDYQNKMARFLENHDEPRAAAAFPPGRARSRGGHHVPVPGAAVLPPGAIRGAEETDLAASLSRPVRTRRPDAASSSTSGCSPCCASRWCATASGNCSNACRPGKATGPGIASWPLPGKAPVASGCWWR